MKIESINKVKEYDAETDNPTELIIKNHWNFSDRVVLEIGGKSYVFIADHLRKAIINAVNAH